MIIETQRRVVRRMTSDRRHIADLHPGQLGTTVIIGAVATVASAPVVTLCNATLKDRDGYVVVMKPDVQANCHHCINHANRLSAR